MVEVASVVRKVRLENVKPSVTVIIGDGDAHPCLFVASLAVGAACDNADVGECAVVIVVEEDAGLRVNSDVNVGPSVVVEVIRHRGDGITRAGLEDARLFRNIRKSPIAVVVIKKVRVAGKPARAAHDRDPFPLARRGDPRQGILIEIELDVIANEKIEVPIAVVVEKSAAGAPVNLFVVETSFASHVGERAIAVVVEQDIMSPETAKQVIPAVVVIVADAHSGLPPGASQAGFLGDIGEGSVTIILEQLRSRLLFPAATSRPGEFRWSDKCRASRRCHNQKTLNHFPLPQ